jgi:hypothetical protein
MEHRTFLSNQQDLTYKTFSTTVSPLWFPNDFTAVCKTRNHRTRNPEALTLVDESEVCTQVVKTIIYVFF